MKLDEYEGYCFSEDKLIKDKSYYCHNYYTGIHGEEIYAWSDDDNYTEYSIAGIPFAESFCSKGDIMHVYEEFRTDLTLDKVIRCKDCRKQFMPDCPMQYIEKHSQEFICQNDNDFCSFAERKEN